MAIQIRRGTNAQWEAQNGNIVSGEPAIATDTKRFFVGTGTGTFAEFPTIEKVFDMIYPVGSIYMSVNSTSPATLFGGTWAQIEDTFLLSAGSTYTAGATGGEATHTLTAQEMPSHRHGWSRTILAYGVASETTLSGNQIPLNENGATSGGYFTDRFKSDAIKGGVAHTGGGSGHNNMPPYLVVYMWKRTA